MSYFKIKGVIPPMITPFIENGQVNYDYHVRNLEKWNEYNLAGYLVLGSNSETVYLTEEEKTKLVELTVKHANKDKIILAGTGLESTKSTINLTNKVASMGVDAALVLTPSYYAGKMDDKTLIAYFTEVADNTKIPVMIYNVTKFTHVNISPYAVKVLSRHPNIIGMKDSSGSIPQLVDFKTAIDMNEFNLLVGTASAWYPALALGIEGAIMALANCSPKECIEIQEAYEKGNIGYSRQTYERMFLVNKAVTGTYGIAGLKQACDLLGFNGGFVRSPLLQLGNDEIVGLKEILRSANLL